MIGSGDDDWAIGIIVDNEEECVYVAGKTYGDFDGNRPDESKLIILIKFDFSGENSS